MSQRSITAFFKPASCTDNAAALSPAGLSKSTSNLKKRDSAPAKKKDSPPAKKKNSPPTKKKDSPPTKKKDSPPAKKRKDNNDETNSKTVLQENGEKRIKVEPTLLETNSGESSKDGDVSMQEILPNNSQKKEKAPMVNLSVEPSQSESNFDPSKANYHPIEDAYWKGSKSTPYLALARTFELIEDTRARLKMVEILGNFFCSVILLNPEDLLHCVYLSINQLAPAYEGVELGVAETTLMKVIAVATGRELKFIKTQTQETGDLGIVAERSRVSQRMMFTPKSLTIPVVYQKLREIAKISGKSKSPIIHDLFVACRHSEARFIVRSLIGKMRIGLAEKCLFQALAAAVVKSKLFEQNCSKKELQSDAVKQKIEDTTLLLKTAYCQCPNFDKIISTLQTHGMNELLEYCAMEPGVPLKPMLAHPTRDVREVLDRLKGNITCEWKYDGERAQIHCDEKGNVNIYSRNQENNTTKYPDIIERIGKFTKSDVRSYIVDSEVVAWDISQEQILPFQVLSTRKRKNVDMNEIKVQVCVYVFDLLYLNGNSLTSENFVERRRLLKESFNEIKGEFQFATSNDTTDPDEIQGFLEESIKGNCEGLMIKSLDTDASYEIAKRSRKWLKLKKDYLSGVGDSLDLVVIGGYKGKGKRTGVYGGFLLACYDDENEEYQSICKIGTGLNDDDLGTHATFFKEHIINTPKSYYRYDTSLTPDDWFESIQVWEVKCADLSLSPVHKAGIGIVDPEKGISLRFPRFIRVRDDKSAEDATSAQQVAYMYRSQDQVKNQKTNNAADFDDDFY